MKAFLLKKKQPKKPLRSLKIYWQIKHKYYLKVTFGGIPLWLKDLCPDVSVDSHELRDCWSSC